MSLSKHPDFLICREYIYENTKREIRKEGMNVIRFDQEAIWGDKYDWKQEMKNILTFTSDKRTKQLKETEKRYQMYANEHNDKSKRRSIPEIVKRSHAMFANPNV